MRNSSLHEDQGNEALANGIIGTHFNIEVRHDIFMQIFSMRRGSKKAKSSRAFSRSTESMRSRPSSTRSSVARREKKNEKSSASFQ